MADTAYTGPSALKLAEPPAELAREPLVLNQRSPGWLSDTVAGVVEAKTPLWWWISFGISFPTMIMCFSLIAYLIGTGVGVWGNMHPVMWAWDITNFVWWIGIGHAGTLISAILFLLRQRWRTSINRAAEAMTIFAVMCAGIYPLIHIGRGVTIVCLLEKGEPVFTRDISIGGQVHIDAVMRELGHTGLDELAARRILHGQFPSDVLPEQVAAVLREASAQLVLEVRKTVDFYRATAPVEKLSRIVVSGGAYQAVGLVDLLASEFGAPVDVFDPFRRVTKPSRAIGAEVTGPAYAVAVGLAMRQEGDR